MRLVLFGPPGAGKGTQASRLSQTMSLRHISTGVIIRQAINEGSDLGKEAQKYVDKGRLVPGPIVRKLAEDALVSVGLDDFILDGYPRTLEQAEWLTEFSERHNAHLHAVISLQADTETLVKRLSRRRVNRKTGENYHLDYNPPPEDVSPEDIVQRPDDQPDAIRKRIEVYREETYPVEEFYRQRGILVEIDGKGEIDEVFQRILSALKQVSA